MKIRLRHIWLIEITAWLLIILCGLSFFIYKTAVKDNAKNTYYIFFDDAGGLVKGSPVKLMGITAGYIKDIKIFDNKVFVSMVITKNDIKIPKSAIASIEFYGLGGSSSLELMPHAVFDKIHREEIIPSKAYRVQDFWDGMKLSAETMIDIYGGAGRAIDNFGLLNNKRLFFQSNTVKEYIEKTQKINHTQEVIINKLSGKTPAFQIKKI